MRFKRNLINVIAAVSAAFLHIFSLWQLDLICVGPVWQPGWAHPNGAYSTEYFQCWLWKTTIGGAYDVLFFVNFLSFWVLFAALWFWQEDDLTTANVSSGIAPVNTTVPSRWRKLAQIGVWFGFALALEGSFEQALQASPSPIWSSIFGFPMLHHYLIGFIILAVSLLILEFGRGAG